MCDPVAGPMAALMVIQAYQSQQSAMASAEATNDAFSANQALQNEAYTKDMEAFWGEEIAIQKQAYQNAEDAADAKIDMLIQGQEASASLKMANLESGASGASPSRALHILRRDMANRWYDLDEQFQRGITNLKGERKALQHDKIARRYSAMGQINSMQRDPGLTGPERMLGYIGAGAQGYAMGKSYNKTPGAKTPGKPYYTPDWT
jgi:hypothetical protein